MEFSIVIPVFDREDVTRKSMAALMPTLSDAGRGEVIVVDGCAAPLAGGALADLPSVRVIRSESNGGFAEACNAGARSAAGRLLCFLGADLAGEQRWLSMMSARLDASVGAVGARLLFANDTIEHAGVVMRPTRFGYEGFQPYNLYKNWARTTPQSGEPADFEMVSGACLLTPRELFIELGGFDETYFNGCEDYDYCLRIRERGLRVVYEPGATLRRLRPHTSAPCNRRVTHNLRVLGARFGAKVEPDQNRFWPRSGGIYREALTGNPRGMSAFKLPAVTIVVHGEAPADPAAFLTELCAERAPVEEIVWLSPGDVPQHPTLRTGNGAAVEGVRALLERRGDHYFAFVDTGCRLTRGWLDELVDVIEYGCEVAAATVGDEEPAGVEPSGADARCTLLNLRDLPRHIRFGDVDSVDGAIVDLTLAAVRAGLGVRAVRRPIATLPRPVVDARFALHHGAPHDELRRPDHARMEAACAEPEPLQTFASIVILSWNAPQHTLWAVESVRAFTHSDYEIIIIDNGSGAEARAALATLEGSADLRIIYNPANTGFAHGCNQGIAAARGTHVVLLHNDVVVTEGWLESLLGAQHRDPLVGVSAPRTNAAAGHQQLHRTPYGSLDTMYDFARRRATDFANVHYRTNRASSFCLCVSRAVIDEVGGIDPRYGPGGFEDDDYCIRARAAGYQIAICEDAFVHHFAGVSYAENKVDTSSHSAVDAQRFAERWNLPAFDPATGYNAVPVHRPAQPFCGTANSFKPSAWFACLWNDRDLKDPVQRRQDDAARKPRARERASPET